MRRRYGWLLVILSLVVPVTGCGYVAAGAAGAAAEHQHDQQQHREDAD